MKEDDDTDQGIGDDKSEGTREDTRETTLSSDIEEDDLYDEQNVLLLSLSR
jgi:hypothetical protein